MKKNVLIFGLVMGTIMCIHMFYMVNLCYTQPDFNANDVLGYAAMVVVFSLIFFGVKNYRDKELGGIISFGKAFKTGLLIALTASTFYVIVWLFYYYLLVPDYLDKFIPHMLKRASKEGAAELAAVTKEMDEFREMYKNPVFVVLITYFEVLPVALLVTLLSSFILKRKVAEGHGNS